MDDFFTELYQHLNNDNIQKTTNFLLFYIDDLLEAHEYEKCDSILATVDVSKIPSVLMLSFLAITNSYKEDLPSRSILFNKIESWISETAPEKLDMMRRFK